MTHCRVDPNLPLVADADIVCTGCGQTIADIVEGGPALPERHYRTPQPVSPKTGLRIGTAPPGGWNVTRAHALCPMTRDDLTTLIYRAQRAAAGLGPPQAHPTPIISLAGAA